MPLFIPVRTLRNTSNYLIVNRSPSAQLSQRANREWPSPIIISRASISYNPKSPPGAASSYPHTKNFTPPVPRVQSPKAKPRPGIPKSSLTVNNRKSVIPPPRQESSNASLGGEMPKSSIDPKKKSEEDSSLFWDIVFLSFWLE
ncbi:unnamed protein product [Periconia digitata]|uniref:Uncharacterized protein n=1 Tax=Periconia digitata TaxID=1303443 RepID=A0A9W4U9I8_9PLEO|nr:unnamed protein product [Periconia digitata]